MKQLIMLVCFCFSAFAEDIYVSESGAGLADGSSCANAHSVSWLNTQSNWGAGVNKVSAGDTVHLCGRLLTAPIVQASGSAGNVITILFETGASVSTGNTTTFYTNGKEYLVIDGGSNGVLECTNNGTLLGNQSAIRGLDAEGSGNLDIKNLILRNFYVHTAADTIISTGHGIYLNSFGSNISIHNCSFSDLCWCISPLVGLASPTSLNIYSNSFVNYDHGIAGLQGMGVPANVRIYNNHFGTTANWDQGDGHWHHDGIHIYYTTGNSIDTVEIFNNLFDGDWGVRNTAHIFIEGKQGDNPNLRKNFLIYNNVFIQFPGQVLNNGFVVGGGDTWRLYNNTFLGSGTNSTAVNLLGGPNTLVNNISSGVATFINGATTIGTNTTFGVVNMNVYANLIASGNHAWTLNGTNIDTLGSWQNLTKQESNSVLTSTALLNSDGTLQVGSQAIAIGTNLSSVFTTDFSGRTRRSVGAWDIGAYEFFGHANIITGGSVLRNAVLQ